MLKYKNILFDDYTDQRGLYNGECGDFWVEICKDCYEKHKDVFCGHVTDDNARGYCCVCGCGQTENAWYYVDFSADEVEIVES